MYSYTSTSVRAKKITEKLRLELQGKKKNKKKY